MAYIDSTNRKGTLYDIHDTAGRDMIAPAYSTTSAYAVGDYVIYNDKLYRCTVAIASGEAWTAAHWTAVNVGGEVGDLKSQIAAETGVSEMTFVEGYYSAKNIGDTATFTSNSGYVCAIAPYTGKPITVNLYGASAARAWGYLDSNYKVLDIAPANTNYDDVQLPSPTNPGNVAYVYLNNRTATYRPTGYYGRIGTYPVDAIDGIVDYVDELIAEHGTHEVKYVRCLSYEPYPDDTQGDFQKHPVRGCCLCGKKLIYNVYYRNDNPYYLGALTIGSRLYQISANNKYNIVLNIGGTDTPMHDLTDGDNSHFDIVDMKSSGKYLYLALRGGTGYPDITKVNGYMVAIDTDDMSVIGYDTSPGKTSGLFVFEDYLIAGEQSSGWSVYKLANGVPTRVYRYAVASLTPYEGEWQQPCAFRNNGTMYIAIARYTRGVDLYSYDETNNTATLVCRWDETALATIGENLNVFAVKAAYPYIYATITPKTANRTSGSNLMGIAVIDISNTSVLTYQFVKIPDAACGTIPQYYTVAADGTMTLTGFGDPAPNCLWIDNGYIYANNEDKGIAVFEISGNTADFIGNVDIGVWPKYFDMKQGVIFASTQYDYIRDGKPLLTATRPIVT